MNHWNHRTEIPAKQIVAWLGVGGSKYFDWKKRYGKVNEHNGAIPRDHWLDESERKAILEFHAKHPLEGYRRLTFMMLDSNVAAASPSSVYRPPIRLQRLQRIHTYRKNDPCKNLALLPSKQWKD